MDFIVLVPKLLLGNVNFPKLLLGPPGAIIKLILSPSRSVACNGVPKRELGNQEKRVIAFAKSSFLLSPLPPTGGEG